MIFPVESPAWRYEVCIGRGMLSRVGERFDLSRRVLVVTDDGVPRGYADRVIAACGEGHLFTFPQGEAHKSPETCLEILKTLLSLGFTRFDALVAVGGGVVGDLAGFAAATYMRGIEYYQVPTTLLAAVDSSVGGKTGVNLCGIKNAVGAFRQPAGVLIDPLLFESLPERVKAEGVAESIKMALTLDRTLFGKIETGEIDPSSEEGIAAALGLKKAVVERDEKEKDLRRVLNFGHTLGHAIEAACAATDTPLLHGECVALGMLPMCEGAVRRRLAGLLERFGLPTDSSLPAPLLREALTHDKKGEADGIVCVFVDEIGSYRFEKMSVDHLTELYEKSFPKGERA